MHPILMEIVDRCSALKIIEKRNIAETSCGLVFSISDIDELNKLFEDMFGAPIKPTGTTPSAQHKLLTKKYGGIRTHQKLFIKWHEDYGIAVIAMFWPWENRTYLTVRLGILSIDEAKDTGGGLFTALTVWIKDLFGGKK